MTTEFRTQQPEAQPRKQLKDRSVSRKRQREAESPDQRERRLERQREYQREYRQRQKAAKQTQGTSAERECAACNRGGKRPATRSASATEKRAVTLQSKRVRERESRCIETAEHRDTRTENMRIREHESRSIETAEHRDTRLENMRIREHESRSIETAEHRDTRLENMRIREHESRSIETAEHRDTRLENMRIRERESRCIETAEHRDTRLDEQISSPLFTKSALKSIHTFHAKMTTCAFSECGTCNECFPSMNASQRTQCTRCTRDKKEPKLYSADNGMDPGLVPPELQGLTQVEEMLISSVMPIMSLYHLPHGQFGYSGHIINLPQDIATFTNTLPRNPSQLDVLLVRRQGAAGSHKDFRVHRSKVLTALQWLKQHNTYYSDILIDEAALAQLPVDDDITLPSITSDIEQEPTVSDEQTEEPYSTHLQGTFVPMMPRQGTQQEIVQESVSRRQDDAQPVSWPQVGDIPINEFRTEGYMTRAFPTLFPTGTADFSAPRIRHVTIGYYFKHLLMYRDGRFAQHPRFRYFALNTEMRWACSTGR